MIQILKTVAIIMKTLLQVLFYFKNSFADLATTPDIELCTTLREVETVSLYRVSLSTNLHGYLLTKLVWDSQ